MEIIRPALEKHVSQAQVARTHQLPPSTVQLWIKRYREKGLAGLANAARSDKGKSRILPEQAITLVEGLALQTPPRSAASIHRQVSEIAKGRGWKPPSYERVRLIIKNLAPALVTFAHQGAAAYREEFDLLYRRESPHANVMWQADQARGAEPVQTSETQTEQVSSSNEEQKLSSSVPTEQAPLARSRKKAGSQPVTSDKYTFSGDVQISLKRFEESGVARVECPGCGRTWTLSPSGGVLHFKAHDKHKMNTPNTGRRWARGEGETDWNMVGGESK